MTKQFKNLSKHNLSLFIFRLLESAKEMIKEALPIKCLEAVILGMYLLLKINQQ